MLCAATIPLGSPARHQSELGTLKSPPHIRMGSTIRVLLLFIVLVHRPILCLVPRHRIVTLDDALSLCPSAAEMYPEFLDVESARWRKLGFRSK